MHPALPRPVAPLLVLLVASLPACASSLSTAYAPATTSSDRPALRSGGERLPPASGMHPATSGWSEVEDGVWMQGNRLRTAHVAIRSDASAPEARRVARLAEAHVQRLISSYGVTLDLRLPTEPLPVVLHATRPAFQQALQRAAPGHPGWGAFYDARSGTVHVCIEPAPRGALPLEADLRHEMTHQILDLSTPMRGRGAIFGGNYLWLWEGFAAWSEGLGDAPGTDTRGPRRVRFETRRARGEVTDLPTLFALDQDRFEGRHYDQSAVLVTFLMADGVEGGRRAVLATLRDLLRGRARPGDLERGISMTAASLDAAWHQGR